MSWDLEAKASTLDDDVFLLTPAVAIIWGDQYCGLGLVWLFISMEIRLTWEPKE